MMNTNLSTKLVYSDEDNFTKAASRNNSFASELKTTLKTGNRPFICKGFPLNCNIFIVGINPASQTKNFDHYWSESNGFDYNNWFDDYKESRISIGKPEISKTRRRIIEITDVLEASGFKILETNVYSKEAARYKDLKTDDKNTEIFKFLLETIKPDLILVHGRKTEKELDKLFPEYKSESFIKINDKKILVERSQHLSYQFSKADAQELSKKILERLKN